MKKKDYMPAGFEKRLREAWIKSDLSVQIVCDRAGISRSTLYLYLNGESTPSITTVFKLARLFNVSIDYLVSGEENDKKVDT